LGESWTAGGRRCTLLYLSLRAASHSLNGERTTMLLLLLLASLLASSSASTRPGFDYFVLALQWPGTVCRSSAAGPCCSSNACCRSVHFLCLRKTSTSCTKFIQGTDRNACLLYSSLQLGSSDAIRWFTIRKCILFFRLPLVELQCALRSACSIPYFHPSGVHQHISCCRRWAVAKLCPRERTNLLQQPRFRHGKGVLLLES
jgi:hypothetical protein